MRKIFFLIIFSIITNLHSQAQIAINSNGNLPDESALLDVSSTNMGMLIPRMSSTERTAINSGIPTEGLWVYDTDTKSFWYYGEDIWTEFKRKDDLVQPGEVLAEIPTPATGCSGVECNIALGFVPGINDISESFTNNLGNHEAKQNLELGANWLSNDGDNEGIFIHTNGNVGIGMQPLTNVLEISGEASKSTPGDWLANSDARLKKNIRALNPFEILRKLLSLQGVIYEWSDDKTGIQRPVGIQYGFIAQNIQEVFPDLVSEDDSGYLQTPYGTFDAMFVEALRVLKDKIDAEKIKSADLQSNLDKIDSIETIESEQIQSISELEAEIQLLQSKLDDQTFK